MVGTIVVHGSGGEVMAPIGDGIFITGKRLDILVVQSSKDEDVPMSVRQSLVGMTIPTIFSSEQLKGAAPPGSRVAYGSEIVEVLEKANKESEAFQLAEALRKCDPGNDYTLLVFEDGTYEHVEEKKK